MHARQLKFGAAPVGVGGPGQQNTWLNPEIPGDASVNIGWYIERARHVEAARFDFVFVVDSQFITPHSPPHYLNRLEPLTLLSALAVSTTSIGLVGTLTTSYNAPFNVARRLASLDLISGGRAGWNVVTSGDPGTAGNYSRDEHYDYATRYARALEHVAVVRGLWDSYEDDAFPRDKELWRVLRPRTPARAQPPWRVLLGRRSAQHQPLAAGAAGDLPGGRLRRGARSRRGDRRGRSSRARAHSRTTRPSTARSRVARRRSAATPTRS